MRVTTLDDLNDIPKSQAKHCRIIVVDEGQANELRKTLAALLDQFGNTRVALAYRRPAIAQAFLAHAAVDPLLTKVGILRMRQEIDHWMSVLRLLICGERIIPIELFNMPAQAEPKPEAEVAEKPKRANPLSSLAHLTERETRVLRSVSEGKQNKIIAAELRLSEHTIKLHIHNVISKLGVNNRTEAAIRFLEERPKHSGGAAC